MKIKGRENEGIRGQTEILYRIIRNALKNTIRNDKVIQSEAT